MPPSVRGSLCLMTSDLYMLLAAFIVYAAIPIAHNVPRMRAGGAAWALGDRAKHPETAAWVDRLERAYRNFGEWLPVFVGLVLTGELVDAAGLIPGCRRAPRPARSPPHRSTPIRQTGLGLPTRTGFGLPTR